MAAGYYRQAKRPFWRINQNIQGKELRVIDSDGKQLGIFSPRDAYLKAQEAGLDLVEIAPSAKPPVAKIIDFTKFKYQQDKKDKEARLKEKKGSEQKEVWLTPYIGENDYQVRLDRVKEFLTEGHKVRIVVKFTGPQLGHKEFGYFVSNRVKKDTIEMSAVDQEPKFLGRQLMMTLSPVKKKKIAQTEEAQNEEKQESKV